jgi:hypothetical protein
MALFEAAEGMLADEPDLQGAGLFQQISGDAECACFALLLGDRKSGWRP